MPMVQNHVFYKMISRHKLDNILNQSVASPCSGQTWKPGTVSKTGKDNDSDCTKWPLPSLTVNQISEK